MFVPPITSDFEALIAVVKLFTAFPNWLTFTASVGATPAAIFVILFPPLSSPLFVSETDLLGSAADLLIVTPEEFTVVVFPAAFV